MELTDKNELHNTLLFMESMEDLSYGKKIYNKVIQQVVKMPTIEAEPKHGMWFKTGQSLVYPDKFRNYFCSECGFELDAHIRQEPNFCPNCGADMRGVEDGNTD